jgi:hypothetical protein
MGGYLYGLKTKNALHAEIRPKAEGGTVEGYFTSHAESLAALELFERQQVPERRTIKSV